MLRGLSIVLAWGPATDCSMTSGTFLKISIHFVDGIRVSIATDMSVLSRSMHLA